VLETIRSWHRPTIEAAAASAGATCTSPGVPRANMTLPDVSPPGPWDAFAFTGGRIVTGANRASAKVTAEEVVKAFDKL
jgi:hypothetical protein